MMLDNIMGQMNLSTFITIHSLQMIVQGRNELPLTILYAWHSTNTILEKMRGFNLARGPCSSLNSPRLVIVRTFWRH